MLFSIKSTKSFVFPPLKEILNWSKEAINFSKYRSIPSLKEELASFFTFKNLYSIAVLRNTGSSVSKYAGILPKAGFFISGLSKISRKSWS